VFFVASVNVDRNDRNVPTPTSSSAIAGLLGRCGLWKAPPYGNHVARMPFARSGLVRGSVLGFAAFAWSCASYTATIDHVVRRGDIGVTLESASWTRGEGSETRLKMVVDRVPREVGLLDAHVTPPGVPPCGDMPTAGALVGRQSSRPPDAPLEAGERLTLGFSGGLSRLYGYGESPRLDLVLQTPGKNARCVPIPMQDDGRPLHFSADQHLAIGGMIAVEGFTNQLGPVTNIVTFPVVLGAWLGDYRVEVVPGLVVAGCSRDRCPPPSDSNDSNNSKMSYSPGFSIAAGVGRALIEGVVQNLTASFGVTLRYRAMLLSAKTFGGQQQFWTHGPVLAPYVGLVPAIGNGVGGVRELLMGLELPVGYAFAENGDRAVTVGGALTVLVTAL
jgi:hypothetical protein